MAKDKTLEDFGIRSAEEIYKEEEAYLRMMVYGVPGAGKTHLLSSAQAVKELTPAILLEFDNKSVNTAVRNNPKIMVLEMAKGVYKNNRVSIYDKIDGVLTVLEKDTTYSTVIIDPLSALMQLLTQESTQKPTKNEPKRSVNSIPAQKNYQEMQMQVISILTRLTSLDKHILVGTHCQAMFEKGDRDTADIFKGYYPALGGLQSKFPSVVCSYFGIIGALEVKPTRNKKTFVIDRELNCEYHNDYKMLRADMPALNTMTNPTMQMIIDAIKIKEETVNEN